MITRNKLQTKQNVHTKLIGTLIVSPKPKVKLENKDKIKIEIKEENSKPLTKRQKDQRRRRNLREMKNYEWDYVHYKTGKGLLCCEHTKGKKKSIDYTDREPSTGKNNNAVNTEQALEHTDAISKQPQDTDLDKDSDRTENIPQDIPPVNTDNTEEIRHDVHASSENCETKNPNATTCNSTDSAIIATENIPETINNYDSKTNTEPINIHSDLPVNTENNTDTRGNSNPTTYREKDAVDALLLLSSAEDTMDEFKLTKDNTEQDNQIEFSQDVDMEGLMTALHIDSTSTNNAVPKPRNMSLTDKSKSKPKRPARVQQPNETPGSPRGQLRVKRVTLKCHREPSRKYYCSLCNDNNPYKGVHKLNEHHKNMHNPVQCDVCLKWCTTPENLRRHSYSHYQRNYQCAHCEEGFYFKSELTAHLVCHDDRIGKHQCMKGGCGKRFKRKSELSAHIKIHTGQLWKCPHPGCSFEAVDCRYLRQHNECHTENNYVCQLCNKGFSHYMQRKRHYNKVHT